MADSTQTTVPTVRLRRAELGDARLLAQLGARLFEQTFGADNTPEDMRDYLATAFSIDEQERTLSADDRVTWIAEDAATAIGYVVLRRGSTSSGVTGTRPAEVQRIYVDEPWHRRGVGDTLMRACVEQALAWNCDVLWLAVWERNPRAIAFYEKKGFRTVGRQTFQLGRDLQHDFVMARPLQGQTKA